MTWGRRAQYRTLERRVLRSTASPDAPQSGISQHLFFLCATHDRSSSQKITHIPGGTAHPSRLLHPPLRACGSRFPPHHSSTDALQCEGDSASNERILPTRPFCASEAMSSLIHMPAAARSIPWDHTSCICHKSRLERSPRERRPSRSRNKSPRRPKDGQAITTPQNCENSRT
jgi:hypothetical protein